MKKLLKSLLVIALLFSYFLPTIEVFADTLDPSVVEEENNSINNELLNENKKITSLESQTIKVYNPKDDSEITDVGGTYQIDKNILNAESTIKIVSNKKNLELTPENDYHEVTYINNILYSYETYTGEELANKDDEIALSNLLDGTYSIKNIIFDEEFNIIGSYELTIEYSNSGNSITIKTLEEVKKLNYYDLVNLLVNYQVLDENEFTEDANLYISNIIENYDEVIFDLLLNYSPAGSNNNYDSQYEFDGDLYKIVEGLYGVFDYDLDLGYGTTVLELKESILNDSIYSFNSVQIKNEDGSIADDSKLLETGMILSIKLLNLEINYHIIVKGNLVNENGIIDANDFDEIILIALEMSEIPKLYSIAADIVEDKVINIFDVANLLSYYENVEQEQNRYQTEINLVSNYTDVNVGDIFTVQLISNGTESLLTGLEGILNFDPTMISLENVYFNGNITDWFGNMNLDSSSKLFGKFIYLGTDSISENENILTFEFKALKDGNINISLNEPLAVNNFNEVMLVNNEEENTKAYELNITSHRVLSSNANINSISLSSGSISPNFSPDITSYQLFVPSYVNSLTIDGVLADMLASTDGFKTYELLNNYTSIELVVTAEDGTTKTYTINVIKYDVKSSDNYLTSLEIKGYEFKFNKYTTNYDITIKNNVKSLDISYIVSDPKATVEIIGNTNLKDQDKVSVIVTAENGSQRTYTITVHKESPTVIDDPGKNDTKDSSSFNFTKLILILLIIAVIVGLIYMLFRGDKEENAKFDKLDKDLSPNKPNNNFNANPNKDKQKKKNDKNVKRKS